MSNKNHAERRKKCSIDVQKKRGDMHLHHTSIFHRSAGCLASVVYITYKGVEEQSVQGFSGHSISLVCFVPHIPKWEDSVSPFLG